MTSSDVNPGSSGTTTSVACPDCGAKYRLDRTKLRALLLPLVCSSCQTIFRVDPDAVSRPTAARERLLVLVAHESATLFETIRAVLADAGYDAVSAYDGEAALEVIERELPDAVVLDVGLPGTPSFRVVDELRGRRLKMPILLIASVFSKTSYKRRPTTLYGADDYVEQHHLADMLPAKLRRLLHPDADTQLAERVRPPYYGPPVDAMADAARRAREELISVIGEARLATDESGEVSLERARRLAWLIVADIALYNEEALRDGIARGDLERRLGRDLTEGRALLGARVPDHVCEGRDLIGEALALLIAQRREQGDAV